MNKEQLKSLLPVALRATASELTGNELSVALAARPIFNADRFALEPGEYKVTNVTCFSVKTGNNGNGVAVFIELEDSNKKTAITTLGTLTRTDASAKTYGPKLPASREELINLVKTNGIKSHGMVDAQMAQFKDNQRIAETKPGRILKWDYAK